MKSTRHGTLGVGEHQISTEECCQNKLVSGHQPVILGETTGAGRDKATEEEEDEEDDPNRGPNQMFSRLVWHAPAPAPAAAVFLCRHLSALISIIDL